MRTRDELAADLRALGLAEGDLVMVHAALRRIGPVLGQGDSVIGALRDAVGEGGTIAAYADWEADYEDLLDAHGRVPMWWKPHVPPFDREGSRAVRDNGLFPELLRTIRGTVASANPGARIVAIGARAAWLTADHALDYGYGPGSPFAKLAEAGGKVLMLGAPLDTMTLIHHAEHLADIPKRVIRKEVPFAAHGGIEWRTIEEFDTADPPEGFAEDYFGTVVEGFLATGRGVRGKVGDADSVLVDAAPMLAFAIEWIERNAPRA
ncbi:aminoglycoside 3-N-acetyltransferase [Sphingomonas sp. MS122]|uniref:aminoglycoside 3-N-acetyltransferase n=1 Tax=Sphingomonas sp. MS122 TaxID=3412683 RepID=UPI003C2DB941